MSVVDCSSDELSELSGTDIDDYAEKVYMDLKSGKLVARLGTGRFRCPFCSGETKQDYRYNELLQHAIGVGASNRTAKVKANHKALANLLKTDHADADNSLPAGHQIHDHMEQVSLLRHPQLLNSLLQHGSDIRQADYFAERPAPIHQVSQEIGYLYGRVEPDHAGNSPDAEVKLPGNVLFVDKLSPVTQDGTLKEIFSRFGRVISAEIARDFKSGDSLRYAFIDFMTKESCEHAQMMMNNSIIDGRKIRVDLSSQECRENKLNTNKGEAHVNYALKGKRERSVMVATKKTAEEVGPPNCSIHKRKFYDSVRDADKGAYVEERADFGRDEADEAAEIEAKQPQVEDKDSFPDVYEFLESEIDSAMDRRDKWSRVGVGSFGTVLRLILNGQEVAVKFLNEASADPKEQARSMRAFDAEVKVLSTLKHCNLVQLIGVCTERRAIAYEFLPNGNLHDRMFLHRQNISWTERLSIALDLCSALHYLQNRIDPIVHGDITPANILFDESNVAKLGDFGISRILTATSASGTKIHLTKNTPTGTADYIDPEFKTTGILTTESDIYAFGVILMQLASGKVAEGLREHVHRMLANKLFHRKDQGLEDEEHMCNTLRKVELVDNSIELPNITDGLELLQLGRECTWPSRKRRARLEQVSATLKLLHTRSMPLQVQNLNVSEA